MKKKIALIVLYLRCCRNIKNLNTKLIENIRKIYLTPQKTDRWCKNLQIGLCNSSRHELQWIRIITITFLVNYV